MAKRKFEISKQWLVSQGIEVVMVCDGFYDIYHTDSRGKRSKLTQDLNIKKHDKGIIKTCLYYNVGFSGTLEGKRHQYSLTVHNIVYAWFKEPLKKGYDISHINCIGTDNRLDNLIQETHKDNLARRRGAINQYGLKKERSEQ